VEQRKATHAKLILALADAGKCLDAAAVDALADGAAFAEAAVAAARLHARMLQTPDMAAAGDLVSKACGDAVARRGDDAARRRAGLSVLDAFYGAAPAESLAGLIGALGAARTLEDGAAKARVAVHAATAARAAVAGGAAAYGDALAALGGGGARDAVWRGGGPACRAALGGLRDLAFDPSGGLAAARDARTVALELAELLVGGTAGAEGDGALVVTTLCAAADATTRDRVAKQPHMSKAQVANVWVADASPALAAAEATGESALVVDVCLRADDVAHLGAEAVESRSAIDVFLRDPLPGVASKENLPAKGDVGGHFLGGRDAATFDAGQQKRAKFPLQRLRSRPFSTRFG